MPVIRRPTVFILGAGTRVPYGSSDGEQFMPRDMKEPTLQQKLRVPVLDDASTALRTRLAYLLLGNVYSPNGVAGGPKKGW